MNSRTLYNLFIFLCFLSPIQSFCQSISYTAGPNLSVERADHQMQQLSGGKYLIMGGNNGYATNLVYHKSCQIYDGNSNTFAPAADMLERRSNFMSVSLNNGFILAIGGSNSLVYGSRSCEIYDPAQNKWTLTDSLKSSHWGGVAVKLNDGRILVSGGETNTTEIYNPNTKKWDLASNMIYTHGQGMTLTILRDGSVLAVGGNKSLRAAEWFLPDRNIWIDAGYLTAGKRQDHTAILMQDGNVLLAGSSHSYIIEQTSSEIFDISTRSFKKTGNLLTSLYNSKSILLANGSVLTFGIGDLFSLGNTKRFQVYDPLKGTWSTINTNNVGTTNYTMDYLPNGNIFIAGGNFTTGNGASTSTVIVKQEGYGSCIPPILDLDLSVSKTACYGKNPTIKLTSAQSDVKYKFLIGSTNIGEFSASNLIEFDISNNYLNIGDNTITVTMAKLGCPNMAAKKNLVIKSDVANPIQTKISVLSGSELICQNGSKTVIQITKPLTNTYMWSNKSTATQIELTDNGSLWATNVDGNGCWGYPSDLFSVYKISAADVSAGVKQSFCETSANIQLKGIPSGGKWYGTGVTAEGLFSPSTAKIGNFNLTYEFCGFTSQKTITVEPVNSVSYSASNITWPMDTLCGGTSYKIDFLDIKESNRYRLYANGKLIYNSSFGSASAYYTPDLERSVNFNLVVDRKYSSLTCAKDSISISKTNFIYPKPSQVIISIPDTGCFQWGIPVTIKQPAKGVYYYAAFSYTNLGEMVQAKDGANELIVYSPPIAYERSPATVEVFAIPSLSCLNSRLFIESKYVKPFVQTTAIDMGSIYNVNEEIFPTIVSNSEKHVWSIDGVLYNTKLPPRKTYPTVGTHKYKLLATSKFGCTDTLEKEISIKYKFPVAANSSCQFDTNLISIAEATLLKCIVDKKGNTIYIGSKRVDYAAAYSGSDNGIIEKYSKTEGKALWKLAHSPYYATHNGFFSMYITGVTVDDNNDIYITGGYFAKQIQFGGITITHPETTVAYGHTFVSKISESGKVVWFMSSYNPTFDDNRGYETGASDIKYRAGKLYVSARMLYQNKWKNQTGAVVNVENPDLCAEYAIMEINPDGSKIKILASIGESRESISSMFYLKTLNPSAYYVAKIPILAPLLNLLPNGDLAVYGMIKDSIQFGSKIIFPRKLTDGTKLFTEFTAIINPAVLGWKSINIESGTNSPSVMQFDKYMPTAVYVGSTDKVSAINTTYYYDDFPPTYTIQIDGQEKIETNQKQSLVKRLDAKGKMLWKKNLKGAYIHALHLSSDQSQVIAVGTYVNGLSIEGNGDFGINGGITRDMFAMGFNASNGNILWAEKVGSKVSDDYYSVSTLTSCNDLLMLGYRTLRNYVQIRDTVWHEQSSINYLAEYPYLLRIPLTGVCNSQNCTLTSVTDLKEMIVESDLVIFPNPASKSFSIYDESNAFINGFVIRNMQGNTIYINKDHDHKKDIDISNLESGIYLIELFKEQGSVIKKLIVIK